MGNLNANGIISFHFHFGTVFPYIKDKWGEHFKFLCFNFNYIFATIYLPQKSQNNLFLKKCLLMANKIMWTPKKETL